jgi:ribosome recycling factor
MIEDIKKDAKSRMRKTMDSLKQELTKLRTGRAHPSLLDHVQVDYYGAEVPVSQVANISVSDPRTLAITPWEKPMVPKIEKAILASDLGLTPSTSGDVIRLPLPPLTEERRRELVRVLRHEGENARVAVRNIRRDANTHYKELHKEKEVSEDELRQLEDEMQKLTDRAVTHVDEMIEVKEKELMTV